jgi:hypothetical protein
MRDPFLSFTPDAKKFISTLQLDVAVSNFDTQTFEFSQEIKVLNTMTYIESESNRNEVFQVDRNE